MFGARLDAGEEPGQSGCVGNAPLREEDRMNATASRTENNLTHALGEAVVHIWSHLPPDVQHDLFEEAITTRGEAMRQQLAVFLHAHHARTTDLKENDMLEPDSLGG
jgi:hypothetical protein